MSLLGKNYEMEDDVLKAANRKVLVGPLATKLGKRQAKQSRRKYASIALAAVAVFTLTVCVVFCLDQYPRAHVPPVSDLEAESSSRLTPADSSPHSATPTDLAGTMEAVQNEPATNPLAEVAAAPTAHVSFVLPETEKKEAIDEFVERIKASTEATEYLIDLTSGEVPVDISDEEEVSLREWHESEEPLKSLVAERALVEQLAGTESVAIDLDATQTEVDKTQSTLNEIAADQGVVVDAPLTLVTNSQRMEVEVADPQTATNGMKIASTLSTTKSQALVPNAVELETSVVPPELAEDDDLLAEEIEIFRNSLYTFDLDLDNKVACLLYTSPSPRDQRGSRMPSSA